MKRFIYFFTFLIISLTFCACKTFTATTYSLNDYIAAEISQIENIENYSDEAIKTLSVIYRTNLINKEINNNKISNINSRIKELTDITSNKTINKNLKINISNQTWNEIIQKSHLLEFFNSYNINLANLNDITIKNDENQNAIKLSIASKEIDFLDFANYFNLISNKDIKISTNKSFIKLEGYGKGFNNKFNIKDIENLALEGYDYEKILKTITK